MNTDPQTTAMQKTIFCVKGPILPHTAVALNRLAANHTTQFSMALQTMEETVSFSLFNLPRSSVSNLPTFLLCKE